MLLGGGRKREAARELLAIAVTDGGEGGGRKEDGMLRTADRVTGGRAEGAMRLIRDLEDLRKIYL